MADGTRLKRSKKRESGIHGKHYERKVLALIALKCLSDEDIEDFWILSNPSEVDKFDDIILLTKHRNKETTLFMIQVKHKDEDKKRPVVAEKLDGTDSKLGLKMYQEAFLKIKHDQDFLDEHEISSETKTVFILFNNCKFNSDKATDNISFYSTDPFKFINTSSDARSVLRITNKSGKYDQNFLDQFHFYTEQIDEKPINDEIKALLQINDDTVEDLIHSFYSWVDQENCLKLWKFNVKVMLLKVLMGDYVPPRCSDSISESVLNNVMSKFDVTVITQENSSVLVWNEIMLKMKYYCNPDIAWDESVPNQTEEKLLYIKNNGTLLVNSDNITKRLVYIFLVIQRKVPFFIKSTNRLFDSFKKLQRDLDIYSVVFKTYKNETLSFDNTRVFQDLTDIEEEVYIEHSKKLKISFQGKSDVDLYNLLKLNNPINLGMSVDSYMELLQNTCVVGVPNDLPSYYIKRQMKIPVLKHQVLEEDKFMFFIFNRKRRLISNNRRSVSIEFYESAPEFFENYDLFNIVTISDEFNNDYLKRIERLSKDRMYFALKYINKNSFLLIHSNSSVDILTPYVTYIFKKDTELAQNCKYCKINVICNNAGMGKSTFLNFLHSTFSSDEWIINIDLKKHGTEVKQLRTVDELIKFSYKCHTEEINEANAFLEPLYNYLKHKVIWLIDNYEEINEPNLLELFKKAIKEGFRIWIVTRPYLKLEFENVLGALSMELADFSKKDQEMFILKYLRYKNKDDDIKSIMADIGSIRNLLEDSFIGTCQQTMMLTEIFLNHEGKWGEEVWHTHDIYEKFVELKVGNNLYIRTISKLALRVFFTDNALKTVFDLEEFDEDVEDFKDRKPKDFFITGFDENGIAIFSHRTYAEFLAARWLLHTVKKQLERNTPFNVSHLLEMLFLKELTSIRLFLDNMVTKSLPLHSAIINKEEDKIKTLINYPSYFTKTDLLGRTIFHLLSSYGSYFDIGITPKNREFVRNLDVHSEIVQNGEVTVLKPIEPLKPVEMHASISQYLSKLDFFDEIKETVREDNLLNLNSTDYALLSGSLIELDSLLPIRNDILCSSLFLTEERKLCLLFHSIQNKFENILTTLDVNGLNNLKVGPSEMSLLHLAVTAKNLEATMKLTSEHHLKEWGVDGEGNTPFHIACGQKDDSILKYLIEQIGNDADFLLKTTNLKGESYLHILARRRHTQYIKTILKRTVTPQFYINLPCSNDNTPFIISIIFNDIRTATVLRRRGANVLHSNGKNMTAIHYAASKGFLKCTEKLLEWGAEVNKKDDYGMTPLMKASTWGHKDVADLLLKNKAEVNLCDNNRWTALHHAVKRNNIQVVVLLIKCEANVNCVNKTGDFPLTIACKYNFSKIVNLLLKRKKIYGQKNALRIAIAKNHRECMDLLFQAGVTP